MLKKLGGQKMSRPLILTAVILLVFFLVMAGCAPIQSPVTKTKGEYKTLCYLLGKTQEGPITKEEFLAAAKNKEQAEKVFLLCEPTKNILTKEDFEALKPQLKQEVIRLIPPR
jgi:hypothetical protein